MSVGRSIFSKDNHNTNQVSKIKETDAYKCESKAEGDVGIFIVTLNGLTINSDYESHANKFKNGLIDGVNFEIKDTHQLQISVQNKLNSQTNDGAVGEKTFREAIGVAGRHNFTSKQIDEILQEYKKYLEDFKLNCIAPKNQIEDAAPRRGFVY